MTALSAFSSNKDSLTAATYIAEQFSSIKPRLVIYFSSAFDRVTSASKAGALCISSSGNRPNQVQIITIAFK